MWPESSKRFSSVSVWDDSSRADAESETRRDSLPREEVVFLSGIGRAESLHALKYRMQHKRAKRFPIFPTVPRNCRTRLHHVAYFIHSITTQPRGSWLGAVVGLALTVLVATSILVLIMESMESFQAYSSECQPCAAVSSTATEEQIEARRQITENCKHCEPSPLPILSFLDTFTLAVFAFEYLVRVGTAFAVPVKNEAARPPLVSLGLYRTFDYAARPLNVLDLIVVVPILPRIIGHGASPSLGWLRALRAVKIAHIFLLGEFGAETRTFIKVFHKSLDGLATLAVFTCVVGVLLSVLIFIAERGTWDPRSGRFIRKGFNDFDVDEPTVFTSVPKTFWWAAQTFTTTGYGDMTPHTVGGQVLAVIAAYWATISLAMPVTLVTSNYLIILEQKRIENRNRKVQKHDAREIFDSVGRNLKGPLRQAFRDWRDWVRIETLRSRDVRRILRNQLDKYDICRRKQLSNTPPIECNDLRMFGRSAVQELGDMEEALAVKVRRIREAIQRNWAHQAATALQLNPTNNRGAF